MPSILAIPTSFANDATDGGTAWSNPSQAGDSTGDGATVVLLGSGVSQWLVCTGLQVVLPGGAVMLGNEPSFEHWASLATVLKVTSARLVIDGARQSVEAVTSPVFSLVTVVETTLGGPASLLAASITPANVNSSNYGFAIRATNFDLLLPRTLNLRKARLLLTYTLPKIQGLVGSGGVL